MQGLWVKLYVNIKRDLRKGKGVKKEKRKRARGASLLDKKSVYEHLEELRARVIRVFVIFSAFFLFSLFFIVQKLFDIFSHALQALNIRLVSIGPIDYFMALLNMSTFIAFLLTFPVLILEAYMFLYPALKPNEKRLVIFAFIASFLLFFFGVAFGYFAIVRISMQFFSRIAAASGIENIWSTSLFTSFVLWSCILAGLSFQMPVLGALLSKAGLLSSNKMKEGRRYFILFIFILAAIITPPDPLTQILLALPMILLYEVTLFFIKVFGQ
ncbi:MAG TPA: twin-arginine translocase subunit TatC [Candidatus Aenigmarchaeota archaeon]|nr:twin-arginine translocase subunit TatC [Candidatus Aenigmarchaeota archaeon]